VIPPPVLLLAFYLIAITGGVVYGRWLYKWIEG
jgi:hypothetical protein